MLRAMPNADPVLAGAGATGAARNGSWRGAGRLTNAGGIAAIADDAGADPGAACGGAARAAAGIVTVDAEMAGAATGGAVTWCA